MKALVVYFSAEGTTRSYAETLAKAVHADLFEIVPEEPYSSADIKWTNPLARCNREKIGKKDVPIRNTIERWEGYDVVFLGSPSGTTVRQMSSIPSAKAMIGAGRSCTSLPPPAAAASARRQRSCGLI